MTACLIAVITMKGPPPPTPNPPGTFAFAAFGDAPYYVWEEVQYPIVLRSIDSHDVAFAIHVGDIFWRPCTDDHYRQALARFNRLHHPVIYTPGDNEWTDCWQEGAVPLERLARLRQIFFADPRRSVGGKRIAVTSQPGYVENARWRQGSVVFATVHVVGMSDDRPPADLDASRQRMEAAASWTREAFADARATNASAVVIAFQANPDFEKPRDGIFKPFLSTLEEESRRFAKPVLAVHGDGHVYTIDHPLAGVANFTRLQVPGSPRVGWVRVIVKPGAPSPFSFQQYVVPAWKYF